MLPRDDTLGVFSVTCNTAGEATWIFPGPLNLPTVPCLVTGFQVGNGAGGWLDPVYAYNHYNDGDYSGFDCYYQASGNYAGRPWRINVRPTGPREAGEIIVPSSGTVD